MPNAYAHSEVHKKIYYLNLTRMLRIEASMPNTSKEGTEAILDKIAKELEKGTRQQSIQLMAIYRVLPNLDESEKWYLINVFNMVSAALDKNKIENRYHSTRKNMFSHSLGQ